MTNIEDIIDLILQSTNSNPYGGPLSYKEHLANAIDLARLCLEFADNGHFEEAMNIESNIWLLVIADLENKYNNIELKF